MKPDFNGITIGIGLTGSYCTYAAVFNAIENLKDCGANLLTIFPTVPPPQTAGLENVRIFWSVQKP